MRSRERTGNTILIAEDNDGVRALAVRVLQNDGYLVLEARDGVEALEIAAATPGAIDLLISDVLMPRMGGSELASRFAAVRSRTPVLFISGYMDQDAVRRVSDDATAPSCRSPFHPWTYWRPSGRSSRWSRLGGSESQASRASAASPESPRGSSSRRWAPSGCHVRGSGRLWG